MSLMDKSVSFDSTNLGFAKAIYDILKPIFTNAVLAANNTVYFDSNRKDGFRIENFNLSNPLISIVYIVQNKEYKYNYRGAQISSYSTLYYNTSANKDIIAFGFTPGILDFGMGYEKGIGFWEFRIGPTGNMNNLSNEVHLYIQDKVLYKKFSFHGSGSSTDGSECLSTRWLTTNTNFNISLIQLPLFVTSGNFNSLFEVISCHTSYSFNKGMVIISKNKYYRLLQSYNNQSATGINTVLAMEVADD